MLAEAIESVLSGQELPSELIVVDQSDVPDPKLAVLSSTESSEIRYLWTQTVGLSRACNEGIAAARHDLLVFTHDDVLVSATWFGSLVRALVHAGARAVVTGRVMPTGEGGGGQFAPSTKVDKVPAVYEGRIHADVLFPMSMAMYGSCIQEVGFFDERLGPGTPFPAAEDNDFGYRILEAGIRIIYVPESELYHRAWRTQQDHIPLGWSYGRGQGAYYAKYLESADRYILWRMIKDIFHHVGKAPRRMWQRQPYRVLGDAAYVLGMLSGAMEWLWTQRKTR